MLYDTKFAGQILRTAFRPSTFSFRSLFWSLAVLIVFPIFNAVIWSLQMLDHVFYPKLRHTTVEKPVFVLANPRSGTTFLHRLMAMDEERFTHMRLWQTIFPSVLAYRTIAFIGRIDRVVGRPLGRMLGLLERAAFKGWDGVHHVGFNQAEEEETVFISSLIDPPIHFAIPHPQEYRHHIMLDDLSAERRAPIMAKYKRALRAHVFATGNNRVLLSKNVFMGQRIESILEVFPDARFVHLVRHPYSSLASTISMFTGPWSFFNPDVPKDSDDYRYWAEIGMDTYSRVHRLEPELHERGVKFVTFTYEQLTSNPKGTVESIYESMDVEMSPEFARRLDDETAKAQRYQSTHAYNLDEYGMKPADIYNTIPEIFEAYGFEKNPGSETSDGGIDAAVGVADRAAADAAVSAGAPASAGMHAVPSAG
ncbi:MAG: hypothetical protein ACJAYU_000783 [Bradymonadia bacterium]|jgi:hypothetical protein